MSGSDGFYADMPGSRQQVFIHTSLTYTLEDSRQGAVQNWARVQTLATEHELAEHRRVGRQVQAQLAHLLPDADPRMVELVVLATCGMVGSQIAMGKIPGLALNYLTLGALQHGGSIDLEQS